MKVELENGDPLTGFAQQAHETHEPVVFTKDETPVAVLIDIQDYRTLQAISALARDPKRYAEVMESHAQVQQGATGDFTDMEDLFAEEEDAHERFFHDPL